MSLINKLISKSILIIENDLNHEIDNHTVQYQRFIRHIQFLIRRLNKKKYICSRCFIDMVKNHYPNAYNTAFKISK